jgi:uncharacterized repeat protein (TIGR03803 family)
MKSIQGTGRGVAVLLSAIIFGLALQIAAAQTETVLHTFTNTPDGEIPQRSGLLHLGNSYYGMTIFGGATGNGTIYQLTQSTGIWTESMLYSFTDSNDGGYPLGALIADASGNLYGVTTSGGTNSEGVAFEFSKSSGQWAETVLYNFGSGSDGVYPQGPLVFDTAGNLYGTTPFGGASGNGTVYELSLANGDWTETILHGFGSSPDGAQPYGGLTLDAAGNVYGTTQIGGANNCISLGCGIDFQLTFSDGTWTENIIHQFDGHADGMYPNSPPIFDKNGNLYGSTEWGGGLGQCSAGCGTVYELAAGTWDETILHRFIGGTGGNGPNSPLTFDRSGNLYGETAQYNTSNGTIFRLAPKTAGGFAFKVIFTFNGTDGADPEGGLIVGAGGTLYGTTIYGGSAGDGTVFSLVP